MALTGLFKRFGVEGLRKKKHISIRDLVSINDGLLCCTIK